MNGPSSRTEIELFLNFSKHLLVERYLPEVERCFARLTDEQIWLRANSESNSAGNLVLHLCGNVRQWITCGVGGAPDDRQRQREFDEKGPVPREVLLNRLRSTVQAAMEVLSNLDPASLTEKRLIQGKDRIVLEAIYHVIEHFSMHTGQIIYIAKALSGNGMGFYDFSSGVPELTVRRDDN
jgi:uncharacterized damage-inducible protein DinB